MREELDNQAKLNEARRNLAFGNAQADINRQCDELEAELRESRDQLEVRIHSHVALQGNGFHAVSISWNTLSVHDVKSMTSAGKPVGL
jgi:ribosomal protein L29